MCARWCFVISLILCIPVVAQRWIDQFYPRPLFLFSMRDEGKLSYYEFNDYFESVIVSCTIGEFRLLLDSSTERVIPIRYKSIPSEGIKGIPDRGLDTFLLNFTRTDTFTIPGNATLFFFRLLSRAFPCQLSPIPLDSAPSPPHWTDAYWVTPPGWIQDTVIFVTELRRASDNAVLAVLDSVGVYPNRHSWFPVRFGTEPNRSRHFRSLPSELAGTTAYVQIKAYRYGPAPYGFHLLCSLKWCSLSTLWDYDSSAAAEGRGSLRFPETEMDSLNHAYYATLRVYLDSGLAATGKLPPHIPPFAFVLDSAIRADYEARYGRYPQEFDPEFVIVVDTIWGDTSARTVQGERIGITLAGILSVSFIGVTIDRNVSPPVLHLKIVTSQPLPGSTISVVDVSERDLGLIWNGNLQSGSNELQIPLPQSLSTGQYFLILRDQHNQILAIQDFTL